MIALGNNAPRKASTSHESGYSSDYASASGTSPNSSSRASPRGSLDQDTDDSNSSTTVETSNNNNNTSTNVKPVPPKKPVRMSKISSPSSKDFKMIRLRKTGADLGIIIAKKKLKHLETTGFHIVHVEPGGLIDM